MFVPVMSLQIPTFKLGDSEQVESLKADVLKIDGYFIQHLLNDKNAKIIVENIVDFSKKIAALSVAEHIDSKELYELAKKMGIDYSQGFYIGKPTENMNTLK